MKCCDFHDGTGGEQIDICGKSMVFITDCRIPADAAPYMLDTVVMRNALAEFYGRAMAAATRKPRKWFLLDDL